MTTYAVARPAGDIQARIKAAVTVFYQRHRALPAAVVVNPREVEPARSALAALELRVPVRENGGCLLSEVWLQLPEVARA